MPGPTTHDNGEFWQSVLLVRRLGLDESLLAWGKPPEPDTVLTLPDRRIGIEVTQLSPGGQGGRHEEGARDQVLLAARKWCDDHGVGPVQVHVDWEQEFLPAPSDRATIVSDLATLVATSTPGPMDSRLFDRVTDPSLVLPKGVNLVKVLGLPAGPSGWFSLGYSFPPDISQGVVEEAVARKAEKPANYRDAYDEIWLLLVVGAGGPSTWGRVVDSLASVSVVTPYHRVFLFSRLELAILEIRRTAPAT